VYSTFNLNHILLLIFVPSYPHCKIPQVPVCKFAEVHVILGVKNLTPNSAALFSGMGGMPNMGGATTGGSGGAGPTIEEVD